MTKLEKQIVDLTKKYALEQGIAFQNVHESLVLMAIQEALKDTRKWYPQQQKPLKKDDNFSVSVLLYSPRLGLHSIGWFDYELNKWGHISDEEMRDFVWTPLPKFSYKPQNI